MVQATGTHSEVVPEDSTDPVHAAIAIGAGPAWDLAAAASIAAAGSIVAVVSIAAAEAFEVVAVADVVAVAAGKCRGSY